MVETTIENRPLISIIIPAYNCAEYISDCIDSVLAQSYKNIEIILIDDGSTDETGSICDKYLVRDNRIIVRHQNNQGQAAARNNALGLSNGQWICFVDSDDAIHPQTVEILFLMAIKCDVAISMCELKQVHAMIEMLDIYDIQHFDSYQCEKVDEEHIYDESFGVWCITGKLIKRNVVETKSLTNGRIYEDNAVILYWLSEAGRVAVTSESFYYYRINPESTTKKPFNTKRLDFLWAMEQRISFCVGIGYKQLLRKYLIQYIRSTMQMCQEIERTNQKYSCEIVKKNTIDIVFHNVKYSTDKLGIILRALKLWILY